MLNEGKIQTGCALYMYSMPVDLRFRRLRAQKVAVLVPTLRSISRETDFVGIIGNEKKPDQAAKRAVQSYTDGFQSQVSISLACASDPSPQDQGNSWDKVHTTKIFVLALVFV